MHESGDFRIWFRVLRSFGGCAGAGGLSLSPRHPLHSAVSGDNISLPCQLRLTTFVYCWSLLILSIQHIAGDSYANRSAISVVPVTILIHTGSIWIRATAKTLYKQLGQSPPRWIGRSLLFTGWVLPIAEVIVYVIGLGGGWIDVMRTLNIAWVISCLAGVLIIGVLNLFAFTLRSNLVKFADKQKREQQSGVQPSPQHHQRQSSVPSKLGAASTTPVLTATTPAGTTTGTTGASNQPPPTGDVTITIKLPSTALPPVSESGKEGVYRVPATTTPALPPATVAGGGGGGGALVIDTAYIHGAVRRLLIPILLVSLVVSIGLVATLINAIPGLIDPPAYEAESEMAGQEVISVFNAVYFATPIAALYVTWPTRNERTGHTGTGTGSGRGARSARVVPIGGGGTNARASVVQVMAARPVGGTGTSTRQLQPSSSHLKSSGEPTSPAPPHAPASK